MVDVPSRSGVVCVVGAVVDVFVIDVFVVVVRLLDVAVVHHASRAVIVAAVSLLIERLPITAADIIDPGLAGEVAAAATRFPRRDVTESAGERPVLLARAEHATDAVEQEAAADRPGRRCRGGSQEAAPSTAIWCTRSIRSGAAGRHTGTAGRHPGTAGRHAATHVALT